MLRTAFACPHRCVSAIGDRQPRVTLLLLEHLHKSTRGKMQSNIDETKKFILQQAAGHRIGYVVEAQTSPPTVVFHGNCATGLPRFEEWYQQTRLPHEPCVVADERKQQMLDGYPKLKLQMSLEDVEHVEQLLGKPDFASGTPAPHLATAPEPADKRCNNEVAYREEEP